MKTLSLLLLAVASVTFLSGSAHAGNVLNTKFPAGGSFVDPCTGEVVNLSGVAHLVVTSSVNADGTTRMRINTKFTEAGVGATSGAKYHFEENFQETFVDAPGCPFSFTETLFVRLIGQGPLANQIVKVVSTFNIDASCTASGTFDFSTTCK